MKTELPIAGSPRPAVPAEPRVLRAVAFFDGRNLAHAAKETFGHSHYHPRALAAAVCRREGWTLAEARFYAGIPDPWDDPHGSRRWAARLAQMGQDGVRTFTRPLVHRDQVFRLPDGTTVQTVVGQEKGIDVRIALDVVRLAHRRVYEVALVFSQDQDLAEVAEEIRTIAQQQRRRIRIASAYPGPAARNPRGIDGMEWIAIDRATYDACRDPRDQGRRLVSPARSTANGRCQRSTTPR
jgi:uncharacterized LabA/DUF88 family protein